MEYVRRAGKAVCVQDVNFVLFYIPNFEEGELSVFGISNDVP